MLNNVQGLDNKPVGMNWPLPMPDSSCQSLGPHRVVGVGAGYLAILGKKT